LHNGTGCECRADQEQRGRVTDSRKRAGVVVRHRAGPTITRSTGDRIMATAEDTTKPDYLEFTSKTILQWTCYPRPADGPLIFELVMPGRIPPGSFTIYAPPEESLPGDGTAR
jgi:hypothetical protein